MNQLITKKVPQAYLERSVGKCLVNGDRFAVIVWEIYKPVLTKNGQTQSPYEDLCSSSMYKERHNNFSLAVPTVIWKRKTI